MIRRVVIVLLTQVRWAPAGIPLVAWRQAMAEDLLDGLNGLTEAESAIAYGPEDADLADAISWPATIKMPAGTVIEAFDAAASEGFEQAAVLAGDVPDLPGLLVGKLLRPLTTRTFAIAPNLTGPGAAGIAARLPVAAASLDLDTVTAAAIRGTGLAAAQVGMAPGWRRVRDASALATLAGAEERAPATTALLRGHSSW